MDNAVRIDIEGNFNLGNPTRCRRNSDQIEFAQGPVLGSHFTFTLQDMDADSGLSIGSC